MDMMWYRRRGLMVTPHIERVTGAIASFNSDYNKIPLKSLICDIEPIQEGTGDPSPENVRPINGRTGLSVVRCGKNLLDRSKLTIGTGGNARFAAYGSDGVAGTSPTNGDLYLYPGTYTVSLSGLQSTIAEGIGVYNSAGVRKGVAYNNKVLTFSITEEDDYKISFSVTADNFVSWNNYDIQLELGSTATEYEPYKGNTYSVNWETEAGTVYGGYVDIVSGKLVVDRMALNLGNITFVEYTGYPGLFFKNNFSNGKAVIPSSNRILPDAICSAYKPSVSVSIGTEGHTKGEFALADPDRLYISNDDYAQNPSGFNASLSDQMLVYKLATPIEIQLTPQEVKTLLGENNIWSDSGDVSVDYWKWGN